MKYKLQDLIDIEQFQSLQDKLNEIYSFPSAIIDNEGNILTSTAWQDICSNFHRVNPESKKACNLSDQYITKHIHEANPAVTYQCPHGLIDNAAPIIIDGIHYGNFFTGQFFLEAPDLDLFRQQALKYGFEIETYLDAVKKVPVWNQEQLNNYLYFIKGLIEVISGIGLKNLKEAENNKALKASENQYRSLFESMNEGVATHQIIYDENNRATDYRISDLNPAFELHTGISGASARNQLGSKLYGTKPAPFLDIYSKVAETGEPAKFETYFPPLDKHFDISVFSPAKGQFATVFTDISDRVRTLEKLSLGEKDLHRAEEIAELGNWNLYIDQGVIRSSLGAMIIYGVHKTEVPLNEVQDMVLPEYRTGMNKALNNLIKRGEMYDVEYKIQRKSDQKIIDIHSRAEYDVSRNIVFGIIQDITESKQAQEEIKRLNQELEHRVVQRTAQLEETNKELESFVYSVSHDLRAPLRSIMGFSQIISRRHTESLNEEGLEYFGYILEASNNMANLIEDLLRFSRLSKKVVEKESIDIKEILTLSIQNLNQDILDQKAQIILPEKMPEIYGDRLLLGQIFTNLFHNAILYHRKGIDPEIIVSVEEKDESIIISVKDNGQGIPEEYFEKIFNIFQRLHSQDTYPGTGIGLAIVKKAITSLGGKVSLKSEVNTGSTFFISLPKK